MATYRVVVEHMGTDPNHLRQRCENELPRTIRAESDDEATEICTRLEGEWVASLMRDYLGPYGTEPTGLAGISVSPILAD